MVSSICAKRFKQQKKKFNKFFWFLGISYMSAKCEISVGDAFVVVNILHGREMVRVFINDVEQDAPENSCKFMQLKKK